MHYEPDLTNPHGPQIHPHLWGYEEWITNTPLYCGKRLVFTGDARTSLHCHKVKDETMLVTRGMVKVELVFPLERGEGSCVFRAPEKEVILTIGDSLHLPPDVYHRMTPIQGPAELIEFSTEHSDDDVERLEESSYLPDVR